MYFLSWTLSLFQQNKLKTNKKNKETIPVTKSQKMNRSKSTNTFNSFSYVNHFNCQDIQIDDGQQHFVDRHYGVEEMDLGWMKVFEEKDSRRRRRKKLERVRSGVLIGLASKYGVNLNDSMDLKQKIKQSKLPPYQLNPTDTYSSHHDEHHTHPHSKTHTKNQQNHISLSKLPSTNPSTCTTLLKQEPSTGSQQKVQSNPILVSTGVYRNSGNLRMCIDIGYKNVHHKKNKEMFALKDRQLEILKRLLVQQTQSKQSFQKSRDLLLNQLSQVLRIHESEISTLKKQLTTTKCQLACTTEKLQKIIAQSTKKQQKISTLSEFTIQQQQTIQMLTSSNNNYCNQIQKYQQQCDRYEGEINKLFVENQTQYSEIDILVESLQRVKRDLEVVRGDFGESQRMLKEKDHDLENLRTQVEKLVERCEFLERNNQNLRGNLTHMEHNAEQLQKSATSTHQQINNLHKIIQTLTTKNQELSQLAHHQPLPQQTPSSQSQQLNYLYMQLKYLLSIPQNDPIQTSQILTLIYNVIQFNRYSTQVVNQYREILEMFGISPQEVNCHDRLLTQVGDFRNNMGILVKTIRNSQKKINTLAEQNKRLVTIIKNGYSEDTRELQKLIQQQNDQILKYRIHLSNLKRAQHYY